MLLFSSRCSAANNRNKLILRPVSLQPVSLLLCAGGPTGASMVKRPASALDNPVRESPSSTASQRTKVILNTRANGVSAGEVRRVVFEVNIVTDCLSRVVVASLYVGCVVYLDLLLYK